MKTVKLPPKVVQLLNDFQEKAIEYGKASHHPFPPDELRAEMLKARYRLEQKLKSQGALAHSAVKLMRMAQNPERR